LKDSVLVKYANTLNTSETAYTFVNPDVAPFDNIACRKAVLYAADRTAYQDAYGGPITADMATKLLPSTYGTAANDPYAVAEHPTGDVERARGQLSDCGRAAGFETAIAFRADRAADKAAAEALQKSLARVGIAVRLSPLKSAGYFRLYAGNRDYLSKNRIGLVVAERQSDWPDPLGFLAALVDSRAISATGSNTNPGIRLPAVDSAIDEAFSNGDWLKRQKKAAEIDNLVMDSALVLPGIWSKSLVFRPAHLTNVVFSGPFEMYDYVVLGTTRVAASATPSPSGSRTPSVTPSRSGSRLRSASTTPSPVVDSDQPSG
jgi:peptide/nickel transport system substrate-binding protein